MKNGCNKGTIRITLRNEGEDAYKPEIYGDSIIIERSIMREGASGYILKDHAGKKVSDKKKDLQSIMEQFNIQVDNPCTVLMQDTSKMFLNSNKPERKYALFLKATQLEQMKEDLEGIGENLKASEAALKTKEEALQMMEERLKVLEQKVQALKALQKHRDKVKELRSQLAWSHVQRQEAELEAIEQDMTKVESQYNALEESKAHKEATLGRMRSDYDEKVRAVSAMRDSATALSDTRQRLAEEERAVRAGATKFDAEMEQYKKDEERAALRRENVRRKIRELQTSGQDKRKEAEYRKRLEQAEKKKAEVERLTARLEEAKSEVPDLERTTAADEEAMTNLDMQMVALKREVEKLSLEQKRLASAAKDRTAAFGSSAPAVVALVAKHKHMFENPVIGPIGSYVTLLEDEWAIAVDNVMGKAFDKFIVGSHKDSKTLYKLCEQQRIFPLPQLIITKLQPKRYSISAEHAPDAHFKTLLSTIRVDNDHCWNALLDESSPQATILFQTKEDARRAMFGPDGKNKFGPHRVHMAYSKESRMTFTVRNGTQQTSSYEQPRALRLQADVTEALQNISDAHKRASESLAPVSREITQIKQRLDRSRRALSMAFETIRTAPNDLERLGEEIERLETPPEVEPDKADEINALQATMPDFEAKIDEYTKLIEAVKEKKKEYLLQLEPIAVRQKTSNDEIAALDARLTEAASGLDSLRAGIKTIVDKIPKYQEALDKLTADKADRTQKHTQQMRIVEEVVVKAQILCPRPEEEITEAPEKLEKLISKLEDSIERQQREEDLAGNVLGEYEDAKASIEELHSGIVEVQDTVALATQMLQVRAVKWLQFRKSIAQRTNALFVSYLSFRGFGGSLEFDHKASTLVIHSNPNPSVADGRKRDTSQLSGGERSYSTVALLLALWDTMESPFRAMDEFDVFMDTANREVAMGMLVDAAQEKPFRQHIFLTPQPLQSVKTGADVKVLRMAAPGRGQRTIHEMVGNGEE